MNKKRFNLQLFAEGDTTTTPTAAAGTTVAADLTPEISIDLASRLAENIQTLNRVISTNELVPMAAGTSIKMYKTALKNGLAAQVGEGVDINLTEVQRTLAKTVEMTLKKYRKVTTAEAIQKMGQSIAINQTDDAVVKAIQKAIKNEFFTLLTTATGSATAKAHGLQAALAAAWGKIQEKFDDIDATPIFFVSSADVADYLATAEVTVQTSFGLSYIENFLGLGDAFVTPAITAGNVYATAKENLFCAYVPANTADVARAFGLTSDATGLIGINHSANQTNATINTLFMAGTVFYPEDLSAIVKVAITKASS